MPRNTQKQKGFPLENTRYKFCCHYLGDVCLWSIQFFYLLYLGEIEIMTGRYLIPHIYQCLETLKKCNHPWWALDISNNEAIDNSDIKINHDQP